MGRFLGSGQLARVKRAPRAFQPLHSAAHHFPSVHSPAANPLSVDILSYAAMKLSGFPPQRVIGLGTFLDSCRLQYMIAQKLGISANAVQASVIFADVSYSISF